MSWQNCSTFLPGHTSLTNSSVCLPLPLDLVLVGVFIFTVQRSQLLGCTMFKRKSEFTEQEFEEVLGESYMSIERVKGSIETETGIAEEGCSPMW